MIPNEILFKRLYIVSTENTLNEIIKYNKSFSRFCAGEISIIYGGVFLFKNLAKNFLNNY